MAEWIAIAISGAAAVYSCQSRDAADRQANIAQASLDLARNEASESGDTAQKAMAVATRAATAAEQQVAALRAGLGLSRKQQEISTQALISDRAGEVVFTTSTDNAGPHNDGPNPLVWGMPFTVTNTGKRVIKAARIYGTLQLLDLGNPEEAFRMLGRPQVQSIQFGDTEPEFAVYGRPLVAEDWQALNQHRKAFVLAVKAEWRDLGDKELQVRSRCWMFFGKPNHWNSLACPDLDELASMARGVGTGRR